MAKDTCKIIVVNTRKRIVMNQYENVKHTFDPVYNEESRILILGTFPSVKSRENQFYYGHPRNRFWQVLACLLDEEVPVEIEEKKAMLLKHHVAVWDVISSCDIVGSSDSSIKNVVPADIGGLMQKTDIRQVFGNGGKAFQLYKKYILTSTAHEMIQLPSTSPANAACTLEKLQKEWAVIKDYL